MFCLIRLWETAYEKVERESKSGKVWLVSGYKITNDNKEYYCFDYNVSSFSSATGGDAIFSGGNAISVNSSEQSYRIRMYNKRQSEWDYVPVVREITVRKLDIEAVTLRSRWPDYYIPE